MGAAGRLNPKGRSISEGPERAGFFGTQLPRGARAAGGEKTCRRRFREAGPAHRSHARAGNGPATDPEIAMPNGSPASDRAAAVRVSGP